MRVLIDEHFDVRLHQFFEEDFDAETVEYRGWKSVGNGALLRRANREYDGFLTNDQGIPHQQRLRDLDLRIIVLNVPSNELEDAEPLMPDVCNAFREMQPGEVRRVGASHSDIGF